MLVVWPALPLIVVSIDDNSTGNLDNIVAALKCSNRVRQINIKIARRLDLDIFLAAMKQPYPELTKLLLWPGHKIEETLAVVPDSFLGGSAPRLEWVQLENIPFPGLPKLLLSAPRLVTLFLNNTPHSGYFSPDAMVAALSVLSGLESLWLEFESPRSCPDPASRLPPPSTPSVLPVLKSFLFKGVSEYLDDLVACIDAPQLDTFQVTLFNDIVFDTPQLVRFISRTSMSKAIETAYMSFYDDAARVDFSSQPSRYREFAVIILCKGLDWQVSSLEQVCISCLPPLSILEDLRIYEGSRWYTDWKVSIENGQWLELFRPFIAVKNLYLSENFASRIAPALQELVEGGTPDVLPALQNIFLKGLESSGSVEEGIGKLVTARQVANHPIGISPWT